MLKEIMSSKKFVANSFLFSVNLTPMPTSLSEKSGDSEIEKSEKLFGRNHFWQ